jgi:hypothetical protein
MNQAKILGQELATMRQSLKASQELYDQTKDQVGERGRSSQRNNIWDKEREIKDLEERIGLRKRWRWTLGF